MQAHATMAAMPPVGTVRFGAFTLMPRRRELRLRGAPVPVGARAFDLLAALVARGGRVATKGELMAEVWPGTVVEENNLAAQISALRKILASDRNLSGSLQTVSGRGYCFVADLAHEPDDGPGTTDAHQAEPESLSLVVMPFVHLGDDPAQAHFALGLSQTVATDLSRISGLLVISAATAATFVGREIDVRQVARELGVGYVLSGTVLRHERKIRINAQLLDGRSGLQLWSERFDGDDGDLFALEDQITGRIANAIGREVFVAAARGARARDENPRCIDLVMRGIAADDRPQSLEVLREQEALFAGAVALDPNHADALARLARSILLQVTQGHAPERPDAETLARGIDAAERAVALDPGNARVHYAMGLVHVLRGEFERAVLANETAIELDRNFALAHNNLGNSLVHLGRGDEALTAAEAALRLDPRGPQIGAIRTTMGFAHLLLGEIDVASACFERARVANPRLSRAHVGAAISLALRGGLLARAARRRRGAAATAPLPPFADDGRVPAQLAASVPSVLREGVVRRVAAGGAADLNRSAALQPSRGWQFSQ